MSTSLQSEILLKQERNELRHTTKLLEKQVKKGTAALKLTNKQLEREVAERIQVEKRLQNRIAFDHILTTISTQFINLSIDEIDEGINAALEKVGRFTQFDRCYIYLFSENGRALNNTHHWSGEDSRTNFQDFQTLSADLFDNWMPQLMRQQSIQIQHINDVEKEPLGEIKLLALQGIGSVLVIPLAYGNETIGFLALDTYQPILPWQAESTDQLKVAGGIFVSALVRKNTEEALQKERNFAQKIMATMGQGLTLTNVEGVFEYVNPTFARMLGYQPEELIGKTPLEITLPEDHLSVIQAHVNRLEGNASSHEYCLIKSDGSPLYVLVNGVPNYDQQGNIVGSIATITDLTEHREHEAQIEASTKELKALYQAAIQLFRPGNLQELAQQIVSTAINELGFNTCGVLLLKEPLKVGTHGKSPILSNPDNHLTWLARFDWHNNNKNEIPLMGEGLIATAVRRGEIIYVPDVAQDSRYVPDNTRTQSELVIPLRACNHVIGAIDLQSPRKQGFDQRSQRIITVFAEHAGLALETVRLYHKLQGHAQALEIQINERNKAEQALRNSEQRYKQLVECATDMIYRTDAMGYCTYANPVTVRTLGYHTEADLIGQHYTDFIHPDYKDRLIAAYTQQQRQKIPNTYYEFIALGKNGEEVWLGQNVQLILENDEIIGYQALARDIHKRREAEEKLRKRSDELNLTNAKLAKALRTKDEFLANMSHELRTPLNAILGKVEILLEGIHGPITEKQVASLHVIEESGRHLLELINDILDLAKIEAGKITLDIQPISVEYLCESSMQFVRQMAHKKQIKLKANIDRSLEMLHGDERRLKQVLINLLNNAVKFTPNGGEVGLNILADPEQEAVQFQVWDTGIGISPEEMDQLFKPFVQLDSSLARSHEGTGLGLSLVYRLTDLHGGSVSLESQVGVGSCFTITVPHQSSVDSTALNQRAKTDRLKYGNLLTGPLNSSPNHGPMILLVEDNEDNVETFSEYLRVWGYRLVIARSGTEALARVKDDTPDLILMDIQIPGTDGLTAVRQLRELEAFQTTPIVALTTLAMHGDRERCLAAGANEYLSKPVQLRQLVMLIDRLLTEKPTNEKEPVNV